MKKTNKVKSAAARKPKRKTNSSPADCYPEQVGDAEPAVEADELVDAILDVLDDSFEQHDNADGRVGELHDRIELLWMIRAGIEATEQKIVGNWICGVLNEIVACDEKGTVDLLWKRIECSRKLRKEIRSFESGARMIDILNAIVAEEYYIHPFTIDHDERNSTTKFELRRIMPDVTPPEGDAERWEFERYKTLREQELKKQLATSVVQLAKDHAMKPSEIIRFTFRVLKVTERMSLKGLHECRMVSL